ncbi:hypothetical protein FH972_026157 [Carpinus fangiana]|uniref:Heme haloperoxidase family profile domain-containing protein n=1 Tax=Carpinus fangiana TaxID=176857 RepID=A0A5N6L3B5_9ROSI|nr:hypothetical protein FH972_026157 [Carpinus fangiana]
MKYCGAVAAFAATVSAFPSFASTGGKDNLNTAKRAADTIENLARRAASIPTAEETNCGPVACTTFNEQEQLISIDGKHAWAAPGKTDLRGPCPGLNAAANHGYIPRNGVLTIPQTVSGLADAYGMGADLAAGLAAVAILFLGDLTSLTWSIGGPQTATPLQTAIFGTTRGLSYSHNSYESDTSIGRPDAYLNGGDSTSLDLDRFRKAYESGLESDRYTFAGFRPLFVENIDWSIANNPYYFSAQFAGVLVAPAAYNFVLNFMSNRTAKEPSGYLNGAIFKEFFSVTGDYPNFKWTPGHEKIPANWYRRPSTSRYQLSEALADVVANSIRDPSAFRLGGNTNGTNTYVGADLSLLTGGAFNSASDLLKGNNLGCFVFQAQTMYLDTNLGLGGVLGSGGILGAEQLIAQFITPLTNALGCPQLTKPWNTSAMAMYPGAGYMPKP